MPHQEGRGGPVPPDRKPRPPAGPGRFANRQDLSQPAPAQGVYVPPGLPYGSRQTLEQGQQMAPLPNNRTAPPSGAPGGTPARRGSSAPANLGEILTRPTERPQEPLTARETSGGPEPPAWNLLDVLASLPGASQEIRDIVNASNVGPDDLIGVEL